MAKRKRKRRKISRRRMTLFGIFGVYVILMLYTLIFQQLSEAWTSSSAEYVKSYINMIPFKTFIDYATRTALGANIAGNALKNLSETAIMFVPLGIFLPTLWRKQRKLSRFIITICLSAAAIEFVQLVTKLSSFNIDDLIFSAGGAATGFAIWKLEPILKTLKKYSLL